MTTKHIARLAIGLVLVSTFTPNAQSQQVTGTLGSPSATTAIDGKQLPAPDPNFGGVIKDEALQSQPWWAPRIVPPEGAPNVLLIITDDAGFGVPSTFGGVIPTPTMDRVAKSGLRYNNIHSTALCSPTRAALITGRNHHSVGFGVISEQSTGFPGYNSVIAKDKATIGRMMKENGYATAWFGKDHNIPTYEASQVGPFDRWPIGMGFEYFYGFPGGDANQWQPNLFRNTTQIYPFEGKPGWNLVTAMADDAIEYLGRINQTAPAKPFFVKYAPGATHAPHHPTAEWVKKIHDMHLFDDGYERLRERIFENQKRLGVIPADTKMEPWPAKVLKPWDQLSADEKKLFLKQVEIFAAYAAYSDHEIGRVIQSIEDMGEEAVREQDVRAPGCLTLPGTGVPPELALLGDQEAVAGVAALALVVKDALEGRGEQPLELLPEHRQRPARPRGRRDAEGGAEVGEVAAELDVGALAAHRLRRQVGQDQARVSAEREPDVRRREDREREVAVTPDELAGLGVAVRKRRLDQRPGQETDLAGGVGVLLVEVERLPDQAAGAPR